jgi:zinc protease
MGFLLDAVDQKKLDIQREVVLNEKRQGDNQPYTRAEERLYQLLFPTPHPYFGAVIGLEEDLKAAKLDDVKAFFRTYYAPNNATLVLSGDFEPKAAKALVEKYFGPIVRAPEKAKLQVKPAPVLAEKRESMTDQVHLPKLLMAWQMPALFAPGDADARLLAQVLGAGKSSRLYQKLVYEKQLAQDVSVSLTPLQLGSVLEIGVVARPGKTPAEIEAALQAELDGLRAQPVTAPELERARTQLVAGLVRAVEHLGGFGGKADILALYDTFLQDPGYLGRDLARFAAATPASMQALAQSTLGNAQRVVITVLPAEAAAPAAPVTK